MTEREERIVRVSNLLDRAMEAASAWSQAGNWSAAAEAAQVASAAAVYLLYRAEHRWPSQRDSPIRTEPA